MIFSEYVVPMTLCVHLMTRYEMLTKVLQHEFMKECVDLAQLSPLVRAAREARAQEKARKGGQ